MKRTQMLAAVILTAALATPTQAVPPNLAQIVLTVTLDLLSLWEKASALVPKESLNHDITGKLKLYTYEQTERLRNGTVLKTTKEFINNSTLIGSTWTKIHGSNTHKHDGEIESHAHPAIGEIYITAVDQEYSGRGIGKVLTITALNYLKYQGLSNAMLYVDFDNKAALNLYQSLGFTQSGMDILYKLTA